MRQLKEDRSDRCQSVAPPRKHYCIGFYDLNNHVYANSAANYVDDGVNTQHYLGRRLQGCSFLRICLNICSNNLPAIDREDLD